MTTRINVWSGPRNLSTALMYSWRERSDTTVVDEPLYAHYLAVTGVEHPGRDEVLAAQDNDGQRVVREVVLGDYDTPIAFFKQMAKHLVGLDRGFLGECRNVLLTRDPYDMLTSFQRQVPDATLAETGYVELVEILDTVIAAGGEPIVIDSAVLTDDPATVLGELCRRLGVPFDPAMLTWPTGPKPEDGVWARHWYDGVWASTGWQPTRPKHERLLPELQPVYEACLPLHERLLHHRIG